MKHRISEKLWLNISSVTFSDEQIEKLENLYNAKYLFAGALKTKYDGWTADIDGIFFFQETPYPGGSNYFGLYKIAGKLMITNGLSSIPTKENPIKCVIADDGEVIYSRFRHDYRESIDKSVFVDGGRDYLKTGIYPADKFMSFYIERDEIKIEERKKQNES